MQPSLKRVLVAAAMILAFAAGFSAHKYLIPCQSPLSFEEARLVGQWDQFSSENNEPRSPIAFYADRKFVSDAGISGDWFLEEGKLKLFYLEPEQQVAGSTDVFEIQFSASANELLVLAPDEARSKLVRAEKQEL